jgi:site-specific DNA-methyltransferase (adenine-specific)
MFDFMSACKLKPIVDEHFAVKNCLVWDKIAIGMGYNFRKCFELIVFAAKGRRKLSRRDFPDIIHCRRIPPSKSLWPTQKPVELFEYLIAASHHHGESPFVVCDPFVGSGSSAIAALNQDASFIGCDTSERAVEIARGRVRSLLESRVEVGPRSPEDVPSEV